MGFMGHHILSFQKRQQFFGLDINNSKIVVFCHLGNGSSLCA